MDGAGGDAIVVDGVVKRFGRREVLRGVSLRLSRGSLTFLVGPPESGKTVLLRLIAGLEEVDSGRIAVEGFDAWKQRSVLRHRLAYMPQEFGHYPHTTVSEYLDFFEASFQVPGEHRTRLTDELLELVDLQDRRSAPVDRLSSNERQWLSLARCLAHDPDVLLLDAPFTGMTETGCRDLTDMLGELINLDKTVVITGARSLEVAVRDTDGRVLRMQDGQVTA